MEAKVATAEKRNIAAMAQDPKVIKMEKIRALESARYGDLGDHRIRNFKAVHSDPAINGKSLHQILVATYDTLEGNERPPQQLLQRLDEVFLPSTAAEKQLKVLNEEECSYKHFTVFNLNI